MNKAKTLSQGQLSDSVLDKFAMTFLALCKLADFSSVGLSNSTPADNENEINEEDSKELDTNAVVRDRGKLSLGGLHYNIQIVLPPSRDPKVYDALFKSLKEHLIE